MLAFILWYLTISIVGWLAAPLAYRLLPGLADRGLAFSRALGLLVWGYAFWLLASLGILRNESGGLLFALFLLVIAGFIALRGPGLQEFVAWLRGRLGFILLLELLFFVAFAGWALVRAANPEILGTEKPMELAFINAILRSPTFPPHDPWLSGYAISYYYFGYVMVAMLAKLTALPGGVAFNLGIALVFALSAQGAYGLVYNLVAKAYQGRNRPSISLPLLGPLFVLLVGNLEGFLEMLHARGLFWRVDASGQWTSRFWKWLDLVELSLPPAQPLSWIPTRYLWWWRASRVVQDYDYQSNLLEIIDEFPAFSYLLADLHPHVLAMPFVLLAIALAWNVLQVGLGGDLRSLRFQINVRLFAWLSFLTLAVGASLVWNGVESQSLRSGVAGLFTVILGVVFFISLWTKIDLYGVGIFFRGDTGTKTLDFSISASPPLLLFNSLVLGSLAFLNTWDFPFSVALFAGATTFGKRMKIGGGVGEDKPDDPENPGFMSFLKDFLIIALLIGLVGFILYLPFYLGFASQAGGILPNLIYPTRGVHLWVMFAPLFLPLGCFLVYLWRRGPSSMFRGLLAAGGFSLILWSLALMLAIVIVSLPDIGGIYVSSLAAPNSSALFRQAFTRRFINAGGWISLLILFGLVLSLLWPQKVGQGNRSSDKTKTGVHSEANVFVLLMCLLATLLVLGPEFFFLRDQFGWRINTIFKFYYHAWLLWGVAAAFGSVILIRDLRPPWALLYKIALGLTIIVGLVYILLGLNDRTNGFNPPQGWTLDGTAYMRLQSPDEMAAVQWLKEAPAGIVAEAVSPTGGSYTHYARVAMLSGQPGVLGWTGHESQWRGGSREMGSRQVDLERLYCTRNWEETQDILGKYNIRYVYVGNLERTTYAPGVGSCTTGLNEVKFRRFLDPVVEIGSEVIYQVK